MHDTKLAEYVYRDCIMCVVALEDIKRSTLITKFTGNLLNNENEESESVILVNKRKYHGITYPRFMDGVGSLIRETLQDEMPNVKIVSRKNTLWVTAIKKILKGEELLRSRNVK